MPPIRFILPFIGLTLILITIFWAVQLQLNLSQCVKQVGPACVITGADDSASAINNANQVIPGDEKADARIVIWVLTGPSRHMTHALHIKRTWATHFDNLLFMSSERDERLGTIALPNVTEGHDKLWPKTQKAFAYLWEHHKDDADWFMKVDDDTFVVSHNLREYLNGLDPNKPYYLGHSVKWNDVPVSVHFGGTGYILSKAALRLFLEALERGGDCHKEIRKTYKGDEDTELGICMRSMNVLPTKALDDQDLDLMIMVTGEQSEIFDDAILNFNGTWPPEIWGWSSKAITFHKVSPRQMYVMEQLAHKLKIF